jgi:hypothetical protein
MVEQSPSAPVESDIDQSGCQSVLLQSAVALFLWKQSV